MKKMTLRQLIEKTEESGEVIQCGTFDSMTSFLSYFDNHYLPILQELEREWQDNE